MEGIAGVFYLTATAVLVGIVGSSVISVENCKLTDASCMLPAFQAAMPVFCDGIPEVGIDVMDPMELEDIAFDLSGLKFSLKEGRLKGLRGSIIDKVKWDLKKKRLEIDYHFNGTVKGHYTAGGRLLILPITGDGQMKLKTRNMAIQLYIDYKLVTGKDGKEYVTPIKYDFTFDIIDGAHFNLTGLFNGNDELSNTMLTFLNENWKQVSVEFGRPMIDAAAKKIFKGVVAFFKTAPLEDLADLS
ncbi:hypothetical protein O0L34_g5375 [Tuta absoluta]|nr:hypothetical protein O0L34_g5375 [Tuta absoluta]